MLDWKTRVLNGTHGTQSGAILRLAFGQNDDQCPRYEGKASVTSDGYLMCNFVDKDGDLHWGAFVGDVAGLARMHANVTRHFKLTAPQSVELGDAIDDWAGSGWRSN
jgi:hypothetical protein